MAFLWHLGQVLPVHPDPPRDATVPLSDLSFHAGHQRGLDTLAHVTTLWPLLFDLRDAPAAWQTPETKCVDRQDVIGASKEGTNPPHGPGCHIET